MPISTYNNPIKDKNRNCLNMMEKRRLHSAPATSAPQAPVRRCAPSNTRHFASNDCHVLFLSASYLCVSFCIKMYFR